VYGSLTIPKVLSEILARKPDSATSTISGWKRVRVRNRLYPAIIQGTGTVDGLTLLNLTKEEMLRLDKFEAPNYHLVEVKTTDGYEAWSYTWYGGADTLTPEEWNRELFISNNLPGFLDATRRWAETI